MSVFHNMMDLFSRNRRHKNMVEVFDEMHNTGFFPDSEMIAIVLNAYGKLYEFDKAEALYKAIIDQTYCGEIHVGVTFIPKYVAIANAFQCSSSEFYSVANGSLLDFPPNPQVEEE